MYELEIWNSCFLILKYFRKSIDVDILFILM